MAPAWWKGSRGEWYVVAQVTFMALALFGPRTWPGWPAFPYPAQCRIAGIPLMVAGGALLLASAVQLGRSLTPLPYPREGGHLVESGPYALVRHPIYSGGLLAMIGWALFVHGWITLGWTLVLFVLLDVKSRREERWLAERFSAYTRYRRRVRKLIPFVY